MPPRAATTAPGLEGWRDFAGEASGDGLGPKAIAALMGKEIWWNDQAVSAETRKPELSLSGSVAKRGGPRAARPGARA